VTWISPPAATATAETYLPVEAPVTAIAVAPPVALDVDGNDPFWAYYSEIAVFQPDARLKPSVTWPRIT